jgi:CRISPR-associated protein Cas2
MADWWNDLLPILPHAEPPGAKEMLRVIAYDIADPKRLRRLATVCADYGVRVQKSVFEFWLDEERFEELWSRLCSSMNPDEDVLIAYALDEKAARRRRSHGCRSQITERRTSYVL